MVQTLRVRALVVGASGLVGGSVLRALGASGTGTYRSRARAGLVHLDASDEATFARVLDRVQPQTIFIPAAEPNVDWCEIHPDEARDLNLGPIRAALRVSRGARLIGYSSDYVFDGRAGPYAEDAEPNPLSVYGRVKLEVEQLLLDAGQTVIRTTTVFGLEMEPVKNFVLRLIEALRRGEAVRVPSDQLSTPTFAGDLATASIRVAAAETGVWHVAGPDVMARDELAYRVADVFGLPPTLIRPVATSDLNQAAARPLRGGLRCTRFIGTFGPPHRPVIDALHLLRARLQAGDLGT